MQSNLRRLSMATMSILVVLLIVATVLEKRYGSAVASQYIYRAPYTIVLWAIVALSGMVRLTLLLRQAVANRKHGAGTAVCKTGWAWLFHFALVVILTGALCTHWWGEEQTIHLRERQEQVAGEPTVVESHLAQWKREGATVTQVSYDSDKQGATYLVRHDRLGTTVTYTGYILLFVAMLLYFFVPGTQFRRHLSALRAPLVGVLLLSSGMLYAKDDAQPLPPTVQPAVARQFGQMYVQYNGRICPVHTMAVEFTQKVYGKQSYRGLTADQVLCGWYFYYDAWKREPFIRIKGDDVKAALGTTDKYVSLQAFYSVRGYRLDSLLSVRSRKAMEADEKVQLIAMLATGSSLRIWPGMSVDAPWYALSQADDAHLIDDTQEFFFRRQVFNMIAEDLALGHNVNAYNTLAQIRVYQQKTVARMAEQQGVANPLPTERHFRAEVLFKNIAYSKPMAMGLMLFGLLLFLAEALLLSANKAMRKPLRVGCYVLTLLLWLFLTLMLALRWYVSGHVPMSNGHETMQTLAWFALLVALVAPAKALRHDVQTAAPTLVYMLSAGGVLVAGMAMMVSMMTASNPQITALMPVLQSPWLSIHVAVIMLSYALLALIAILNGVALVQKRLSNKVWHLSMLLLYPAVFCLTYGIFIGAIWANTSWGIYWSWDPKEVWALITLLVYALPIHVSLPAHRRRLFHWYMLLAFLTVLFTYFGVNFLLGGMHAYAG